MMPDMEALGYSVRTEGSLTLIYRPFLPQLWPTARTGGPMGAETSMSGRSPIRIIEPDMVVRTLMHGGAFRHITGTRFLGYRRTMREIRVSAHLASHGVPTPEILAVRLLKKGIFYNIDVVTRLVPDSMDLLTYLEEPRQDSAGQFRKAGRLIRQVHELGVFHMDLHIKNLLLDSSGRLWVLDLDKAYRLNVLPGFMKRMNLKRFTRSVVKWQDKGRIFITDRWLENFRAGYSGTG